MPGPKFPIQSPGFLSKHQNSFPRGQQTEHWRLIIFGGFNSLGIYLICSVRGVSPPLIAAHAHVYLGRGYIPPLAWVGTISSPLLCQEEQRAAHSGWHHCIDHHVWREDIPRHCLRQRCLSTVSSNAKMSQWGDRILTDAKGN